MRVNHLEIENFRCFENRLFDFDQHMSVIIGNNTAGKTTLLRALRVGLGAYLQSLPKLATGPSYRCNFVDSDRREVYNSVMLEYQRSKANPKVSVHADMMLTSHGANGEFIFSHKSINWYREYTAGNTTTHNRNCVGELSAMVESMDMSRRNNMPVVLPVVMSFSSNRWGKAGRSFQKVKDREQRIDKAYRDALKDLLDFKSVMDWVNAYERRTKEGREFKGVMEAFLNAIHDAIPALDNIVIDQNQIEGQVHVTGMDTERQHYSNMSDGFKAMINVVAEIAYRSICLNGFLGEKAVKCTPGVVLIDEIELYLHPNWQRHILADLQRAFPRIQFVVTTHSPFIIQSVQRKQLIVLDEGPLKPLGNQIEMMGLDDIASSVMNMPDDMVKSIKYQKMLETAAEFFKSLHSANANPENMRKLEQQLKDLEAEYSENPAYLAFMRLQFEKRNNETGSKIERG